MTKVHAQMGSNYKTVLSSGRHTLIGDEPLGMNGGDMGMSPMQLLLSSLAACKTMTLRWYAIQQKWPLDAVRAELDMDSERQSGTTKTTIRCTLHIEGNLSPEQRAKLLEIADKCPVHRMLHGEFDIQSTLK